MPRSVVLNVVINGEVMDHFTVRVLDSAQSHGRAAVEIDGYLTACTNQIYVLVQEHGGQGQVQMADGRIMRFSAPAMGVAWHTVLFHVDLTPAQKKNQIKARFQDAHGKGGKVGTVM